MSARGWRGHSGPSLTLGSLPGVVSRASISFGEAAGTVRGGGDTAVPCRMGERPPQVFPYLQEEAGVPQSPGWRFGTPGGGCSCGSPIPGPASPARRSGRTRSTWSIKLKAPEVRGIINYLSLLAAVPGLGAPQGAGSRILPVTHRVAGQGGAGPASRKTTCLSAPVCKWGLWLRKSETGGPRPSNLGQRVWGAWLWREGPVRMCSVLPDAWPTSGSCPIQWPSFSWRQR